MEHVLALLKALVEEFKRWKTPTAAVISMITAVAAAIGINFQLKELVRPVLRTGSFFEVSAAHQDTEALINAIQELDEKHPDHALIKRLRTLSKEGRSPFQGYERELGVRVHVAVAADDVGVVCRDSELRDTYLQYAAPASGLITLKVEGADTCNQESRNQVQVSRQTWSRMLPGAAAGDTKMRMNVLLHRPVLLASGG